MKIKSNSVLLGALLLSPALMFFTRYSWWTLMLSYFVWPIAFCVLVLLLIFTFKKKWIPVLCCATSLLFILVYQTQRPDLPEYFQKKPIKGYLSVYHCNVDKPSKNFKKLVDSVLNADADVVVLEEIDDRWKSAIEDKIAGRYTHFMIQAQKDCYGLAVFSKYPILNIKSDLLGSPHVRSFRCEILWEDKKIVLWATRLFSPLIPLRWKIRNTQIRELSSRILSETDPVIVAGDLNLDIRDPYFADLLKTSGLFLGYQGRDWPGSWPSLFPGFFRIWIDHVLAGRGAYPLRVRALPSVGSDHLPVLARVVIE